MEAAMQQGMRATALMVGVGLAFGIAASAAAASSQWFGSIANWVQSSASGTATTSSCNTTQTCISGTGTGQFSLPFLGLDGPQGNNSHGDHGWTGGFGSYNFSASLTINSGTTTPNGFGGTCSAAGGTVTLTPTHGSSSNKLVLDVQGAACAVGASTTEQVLTATYVVDASSGGIFADATGTGSLNASTNSTATPIVLDLSFSGALHFCGDTACLVSP
jgi:hypothetical protein